MSSGEVGPLSKHQFQADCGDEAADNECDGQIRLSELNSPLIINRRIYTIQVLIYSISSSIKRRLNVII